MPRTLSEQKYHTIIEGAGRAFALYGYNRTLMRDVAREAGVALGTLYRYAETKQEIFELTLRYHLAHEFESWHTNGPQRLFETAITDLARLNLDHAEHVPSLQVALGMPAPPNAVEELEAIATELYDTLVRFRIAIRMVDRSAGDWPELSEVFAKEIRAPLVRTLTRYLEFRCSVGALRRPPDYPSAARLIVETCATHAMHRPFSPGGPWADEQTARDIAIYSIRAAFEPIEWRGA